ncbi:MAG TPA: hypothetical protein GX507_08315 [Clostridia bacterium]|nr:hypothetical protein [Clostridia bacterium]
MVFEDRIEIYERSHGGAARAHEGGILDPSLALNTGADHEEIARLIEKLKEMGLCLHTNFSSLCG